MKNNSLLDLRKRESRDVNITIEAQADGSIGTYEALTRNWPARKRLQDLDEKQVGRLDNMSGPGFSIGAGLVSLSDRRLRAIREARPLLGPSRLLCPDTNAEDE